MYFFFQAEDGIRDRLVTGVQTCALPIFNEPKLKVTNWGTLKIDRNTMMSSEAGVFAAGDIVRGASLVVWAIKDGRDAAESIHKYLIKC